MTDEPWVSNPGGPMYPRPSWHLPKGYAADYPLPEYPSAPLMGGRALRITPEQRERARRAIARVRAEVRLAALVVPDATMTRSGRLLRRRVLDPLSHEEFRAMVREVQPTFGRARSDHASGMGYDVASAEARAGRRGLLDSGPHAPVRKGKGIASGWADEEDYGPRYEV